MKPLIIFFICSFAIVTCDGSADVHTGDMHIIDEANRVRLYHGVNFVRKEFPWYPSELLDPSFVTNLAQNGLNVVRLGIMWAGVEPQQQQYNVTYLNIMKQIVESLESNNIYVLFDMHQDVLSSRFGTYDGIPLWLYDQFPPSNHPYPWPLPSPPSDGNWALGYLTEACSHGFQCLYDNVAGAVDSMSNFWRLIATTFGHYTNILGYELINEPWAGNYLADPALLLPGIAGSKNLQPFYDKLANAIRSVDDKTLIFYEPVTYGVRLNGKLFGTGFSHVPGGKAYRDRSVLSYHYYCTILAINPVPGSDTIPVFDRVLCNDIEGPAVFQSVKNELFRLGGAGFLTEFGGCDGSSVCDNQLEAGMLEADKYLQSWTYWGNSYSSMALIERLSRVYARAIAGTPISMAYHPDKRVFNLYYYADKTINKPTEIYVPFLHYPQASYNVIVNRYLKWKVDPTDSNIILVEPSQHFMNSIFKKVIGTVEIRSTV
ncbi:unnamed protein product [Rotaria sp. Silwood2]|nr:unnamed protein product [Rotaria sp. Silwood2]CAF2821958.1 unnamed protein product [Rotaria sp. Silwood2]CAF3246555.1 unnamed protein product [Rotaria sp. Silwood2]CAF3969160.1 unnamed protein product [Rotaria sp. Silwood2]CAF4017638.1 unnamed protein product [Rotaria sp. Silwood2]